MTRHLYLMRHAQTEAHNMHGDKARELTPEGRQQAQSAGLELKDAGIGLVLCSTSTRTRQTYEALALKDSDGQPVRAEFMDALYLGSADTIRQRIGEIEDEVESLLVIGHAPGIPALSAELSWDAAPGAADQMQCSFPTSTVVHFEVDGSWDELAQRDAKITVSDVSRSVIGR